MNLSNTFPVNVNTIAPLIKSQFPDFYKSEGPNFIAFVEAYYEWLEQTDNPTYYLENLLTLRDIDTTLDRFIVHFKEKYLSGIQFQTVSNKRLFIKHALEFWRAKGTPKAVGLLFQLVYGENASVYFPRKDILRVDDGQWILPIYIEVSNSPINDDYIGKQIVGVQSGATAFVDRYIVKKVQSKLVNLFFISNIKGQFNTGEQLMLSSNGTLTNVPIVVGSLTDLDVTDGGLGFNVGDVVVLNNATDQNQGRARVANTANQTGIVSLQLLDGGFGFLANTPIILSNNVFGVTNVVSTNTGYYNGFLYFDHLVQPLANITFNSLVGGTINVGDVLFTYYANSSVAGSATVLSITENTVSGNGTAFVSLTSGNIALGVTTLYEAGNVGANAVLATFTDRTVSANVMGIAPNAQLLLSNSSAAWAKGLIAFQNVSSALDTSNGVITAVANTGNNVTLTLTSIRGSFIEGANVYLKQQGTNTVLTGNGYLNIISTTIGVIQESNNFTTLPGNYVFGANSGTTANLVSISTGFDASFRVSSLSNQTNSLIYTDYLAGNNIANVAYLDIRLDGSNSNVASNGYGFPSFPSGNLDSIIGDCLAHQIMTIGTINSIATIDPGEAYNTPPFVLVINPPMVALEIYDVVLEVSNSALSFLNGETVVQTRAEPNSAILSVANVNGPVVSFVIVNGGAFFTNGDVLTAQSIVLNAHATISTNTIGGITSLNVTNVGSGFIPNTVPTLLYTNSTFGSTNGTGATITTNIQTFDVGDVIYQANSSANIASGIVAAVNLTGNTGNVSVNSVAGTFVVSGNQVSDFFTTANAQISAVTIGYNVNAIGFAKSGANSSSVPIRIFTPNTLFVMGSNVKGLSSSANGLVIGVDQDYLEGPLGWDAEIEANIAAAIGTVTTLQVLDSGFGYVNGEIITFTSLDGERSGEAQALVQHQGFSQGFYAATDGFLDDLKFLQDGVFYQTFSYQIKTRIPFNTYADMFRKVIHVSGSALFGAVDLTSNVSVKPATVVNQRLYTLTINNSPAYIMMPILTPNIDTIGLDISNTATITINGTNTFYEVNTTMYEILTSNGFVVNGTLTGYSMNTVANTTMLFIGNTNHPFLQSGNVVGIQARAFGWTMVERLFIEDVFNANPITGSFTPGEVVTSVTGFGSVTGNVEFANSTVVDVISSQLFQVGGIVSGGTSTASATIDNSVSNVIDTDDVIVEEVIVVELQSVIHPSNTGSFQPGELIFQAFKDVLSPNAVTSNTFWGIVDTVNSSIVTIGSFFGFLANNQPIYGTQNTSGNNMCSAYINSEEIVQIANGAILLANSTVVQITQVSGNFSLTFDNFTPLPSVNTPSPIVAVINNIEVLVSNTFFAADANTVIYNANNGNQSNVIATEIQL